MSAPKPKPWHQQPGESAQAYEAFALYRDLDHAERSIRAAASIRGKQPSLLFRWSSRHQWEARVLAWFLFAAHSPRWIECFDAEPGAEDVDDAIATSRSRGSLAAAREIERRIEEEPDFLRQLSPAALVRLTNVPKKSSTRVHRSEAFVSEFNRTLIWERTRAKTPEETEEHAREMLGQMTVVDFSQGVVDPANANHRSLYSYLDSDEQFCSDWLEDPVGLERRRGCRVVFGPPADVNPRQMWWPVSREPGLYEWRENLHLWPWADSEASGLSSR